MRQVISDSDMEGRLEEVRAASAWPAVVGPHIASQCGKPTVFQGVLTVPIRNASLRQELAMARHSLIKAINTAVGADVVMSLRFK